MYLIFLLSLANNLQLRCYVLRLVCRCLLHLKYFHLLSVARLSGAPVACHLAQVGWQYLRCVLAVLQHTSCGSQNWNQLSFRCCRKVIWRSGGLPAGLRWLSVSISSMRGGDGLRSPPWPRPRHCTPFSAAALSNFCFLWQPDWEWPGFLQ